MVILWRTERQTGDLWYLIKVNTFCRYNLWKYIQTCAIVKTNLRWLNQDLSVCYAEGDATCIYTRCHFLSLSLANNSPTSRVSRKENGRIALSVPNQATYHCPHQINPFLANQWCNSGWTPGTIDVLTTDYYYIFFSLVKLKKKPPQSVDLFKVNDIYK